MFIALKGRASHLNHAWWNWQQKGSPTGSALHDWASEYEITIREGPIWIGSTQYMTIFAETNNVHPGTLFITTNGVLIWAPEPEVFKYPGGK